MKDNEHIHINAVLRNIALGGLFFLPFVAFIVTDSMFFPFIVGKNVVFRLVVEMMFGAWLLLAVRDARYRPKRSWVLWALLAFIVVIGIANIFGTDPSRSFWSNFERMEGYVTILHLGAYVLVAVSMLRTQKIWRALLNTTVVASVLVGIYALFQVGGVFGATTIGGGFRVAGTFGNAIYLAVYMLMHFFVTLLLLVTQKEKKWMRYVYGAVLFLQTFVLFQTATRGAFLGLFGGLVLTTLLIAVFERKNKSIRGVAAGSLIALVVLSGLFFTLKDTEVVQDTDVLRRLSSISLEEATAQSRLVLWSSTSWNGFKERPVLGWGQENFPDVFAKYYDSRMFGSEQWFDRAHNVVFDWLLAGGVLGLLSYLLLFGAALFYLLRPSTALSVTERSVLTGLLAGYFFNNLFVFDNVVSYLLFGTILSYIHVRSTEVNEVQPGKVSQFVMSDRLQYIAEGFVVVAVAFSLYSFVLQPSRAATRLVDAMWQQETIADNLTAFEEALSYGALGDVEALLQLFRVTPNVLSSPGVSDETKQRFVDVAIAEGTRQAEEGISGARELLAFGTLLGQIGLTEEGEVYLQQALALAPSKQQIMLALVNHYLLAGNTDEALVFAEQVYGVSPEFPEVVIVYAGALIQAGEIAQGEQLLIDAFGTALVPDTAIINAYAARDDFETVKELWAARVEQDPYNIQNYVSFAATLNLLGDTEGAIEQLETAIFRVPAFQGEGEFLIQQLESGEL